MPANLADGNAVAEVVDTKVRTVTCAGVNDCPAIAELRTDGGDRERLDVSSGVAPLAVLLVQIASFRSKSCLGVDRGG